MKKKLFQNYNFEFEKSDKKVIKNFCKQAVSQMAADERFYKDVIVFNSIIEKINEDSLEIRLTKDEKMRLVLQIKENVKHLKNKMDKAGFLTRWLYKSAFKQYNNLLTTYFND